VSCCKKATISKISKESKVYDSGIDQEEEGQRLMWSLVLLIGWAGHVALEEEVRNRYRT
jgi:hypothetical protein